jgi:hypothetical protein
MTISLANDYINDYIMFKPFSLDVDMRALVILVGLALPIAVSLAQSSSSRSLDEAAIRSSLGELCDDLE